MKFTASAQGSISAALQQASDEQRASRYKAITQGGNNLKDTLRSDVQSAGLGDRLAKTWQIKVYPSNGRGRNPAAYVYSKAPNIIDSYARGATIVATGGGRFLAIPTSDVPRKRQGNSLTPQEVESRYGKRLIFISPKDRGFRTPSMRRDNAVGYLVIRDLVIRKTSGRFRNASPREIAGSTRNPRPVQMVIMFVLVAAVHKPKLFDLDARAEEAGANTLLLLEATP